jgi:predicted amidohydrolase
MCVCVCVCVCVCLSVCLCGDNNAPERIAFRKVVALKRADLTNVVDNSDFLRSASLFRRD